MRTALGPRLTYAQWEALHWLASPTAYASGSFDGAALTGLVRQDDEGRWWSTPKGRKALEWYPVWVALEHAAKHGFGYMQPKMADLLAKAGLVVDLGGPYPKLDRTVRLTDAGRALVVA